MKIETLKGTNDYLPKETEIRDKLMNTILEVYKSCGFSRISTPAIESIENLDKSDGGENLNLIFRILKRGDKLQKALEEQEELSDMGLRYDLTLPLSRFYANNSNELSVPFKCIQIDRVYRAERPQKGRLREFVQCDIDVLGTNSYTAEVELITTTAAALTAISLTDFTIRVNNRALLTKMLLKVGFPAEMLDSVCICFDKLDKIGMDGVKAELLEKGLDSGSVDNFVSVFGNSVMTLQEAEDYLGACDEITTLKQIIDACVALSTGYKIQFDISLVRGQGYYTGTVFEVTSKAFGGSVAGGGRYDKLIERFTGKEVPAVGFSIGFERIYSILMEKMTENTFATLREKVALIYEEAFIVEAITYANTLKDRYDVTLQIAAKKIGKQLGTLQKQGFNHAVFLKDTSDWRNF